MRINTGTRRDAEARRVAYHEAGHAVVAWRNGFRIDHIDMTVPEVALKAPTTAMFARGVPVPIDGERVKWVIPGVDGEARRLLLPEAGRLAQELLAGNLALRRKHPRVSVAVAHARYGYQDYRHALNLAEAFHGGDEDGAGRWLADQWKAARRLLRDPALWAAVEALAPLLKPATWLAGSEAEAVIAGAVEDGGGGRGARNPPDSGGARRGRTRTKGG